MVRKIVASAVAFAVMTGAAWAADLPNTKGPPAFAPPPPVFSWTGFYVGANVGYDFGDDPVKDVDGYDLLGNIQTVSPHGVTGGGQIGYNWQIASFIVLGVEGEGGYMSLTGSDQYAPFVGNPGRIGDSIAGDSGGAYGAVTGKFGLTADRLLFYTKGGVAFGDFVLSYTDTNPAGTTLVSGTSNHANVGFTVGAGLEYALTQNWSFKGEYDFYDFGTTTNYALNNFGVPFRFHHDLTASRAVVGVNYRFDMFAPPGPVMQKY